MDGALLSDGPAGMILIANGRFDAGGTRLAERRHIVARVVAVWRCRTSCANGRGSAPSDAASRGCL